MEKKKNSVLGSALALVLIFAVFAAAIFGLNIAAAPLIEQNNAAAALAPLYQVMEEAKGFELVYDAADPSASALTGVPATVQSIYAETSGLGYGLRLSTTEGYTHDPIEISFAVDMDGRILGAQVDSYPDTKDMGVETYPLSYVGQDSTLADISLVAGVTYSSSAFKNAIADGFTALTANGLVSEGVKGPEQLLTELLPVVYPGLVNNAGTLQVAETESTGTYIQKGMKALTESGMAYIMKDGEEVYGVIVNGAGIAKAFDTEGNDITDSVSAAALDEAKDDAAKNLPDFAAADTKAIKRMLDGAELTALPLDTFNSVTGAYLVQVGEESYYAFSARSYGYSNLPVVTWYVLNGDGAIVQMNAEELILIKEYFSAYTLDEPSYKAGFEGLTADSFTGEQALIAGATESTEAVTTATRDIFEAFRILSENGGVEHE